MPTETIESRGARPSGDRSFPAHPRRQAAAPVFADLRGRRSRMVRRLGGALAIVAALWLLALAVALTGLGALPGIPGIGPIGGEDPKAESTPGGREPPDPSRAAESLTAASSSRHAAAARRPAGDKEVRLRAAGREPSGGRAVRRRATGRREAAPRGRSHVRRQAVRRQPGPAAEVGSPEAGAPWRLVSPSGSPGAPPLHEAQPRSGSRVVWRRLAGAPKLFRRSEPGTRRTPPRPLRPAGPWAVSPSHRRAR